MFKFIIRRRCVRHRRCCRARWTASHQKTPRCRRSSGKQLSGIPSSCTRILGTDWVSTRKIGNFNAGNLFSAQLLGLSFMLLAYVLVRTKKNLKRAPELLQCTANVQKTDDCICLSLDFWQKEPFASVWQDVERKSSPSFSKSCPK